MLYVAECVAPYSPPLPEPRPTCIKCGCALHWQRTVCLVCGKEVVPIVPMPEDFKIVEMGNDFIYLWNGDVIGRCGKCGRLSSDIRFVWDSRYPDKEYVLCTHCR